MKRKGDKKEWNDPLGKMIGSLKKFSPWCKRGKIEETYH